VRLAGVITAIVLIADRLGTIAGVSATTTHTAFRTYSSPTRTLLSPSAPTTEPGLSIR
jgi:hypothetical protein